MEKQPENNQNQEVDDSTQTGREKNHNFSFLGPYEGLTTKIFDELIKVFAVFARWMISLSVSLAPKHHKEMIKGARGELGAIDGYLAKFLWSLGILGTAIRLHFTKRQDKKEEAEQES
jgi:hypothetical protein